MESRCLRPPRLRQNERGRSSGRRLAAGRPRRKAQNAKGVGDDRQEVPGRKARVNPMKSPFHIAVINDEIAHDFAHACDIAANEFGMCWIELRGMWNKNILKLDAKEIAETLRSL